jgi:hypothetical protein
VDEMTFPMRRHLAPRCRIRLRAIGPRSTQARPSNSGSEADNVHNPIASIR